MGYVCTNCNFRPKIGHPLECPYCGKKTIEKERSAEELLDDIDKISDK
jgi:DNA-directed RNA polymerase subunit RPC12/RpoP